MNEYTENRMDSSEVSQGDVDVVIPCFGNYANLTDTVRSVLEQDAHIGVVILSDDGSGKPFPQEVLDLLSCKSGIINIMVRQNENNLGTVLHLNRTAALCRSRYVKFLSSGDAFLHPFSLSRLVAFADRHSAAPAVTSRAQVSGRVTDTDYYVFPQQWRKKLFENNSDFFESLCHNNFISAAGSLYRQDFFRLQGGFDTEYRYLEDWPSWLRLARTGLRVPCLWEVTCYYNTGGVSSKNANAYLSPLLRRDMLLCYEKEILPYFGGFGWSSRRGIQYRYALLTGKNSLSLFLHYPVEHAVFSSKFAIKKLLTRSKLN